MCSRMTLSRLLFILEHPLGLAQIVTCLVCLSYSHFFPILHLGQNHARVAEKFTFCCLELSVEIELNPGSYHLETIQVFHLTYIHSVWNKSPLASKLHFG